MDDSIDNLAGGRRWRKDMKAMHKQRMGLLFCIAAFAVSAAAQTTVTNNNDGAAGTLPVYTGSATLGNSVITQSDGNVGIGTTTPVYQLDIQNTDIAGASAALLRLQSPSGWGARMDFVSESANGRDYGIGSNFVTAEGDFSIYDYTGNAARIVINNLGNVGIGTTTPGATLEVNGGITLTANSNGAITFQDGTTQKTAFNPALCGADYAEAVDVTGDRTNYEPGDLLVIDPDTPGKFLKSNQAYSTLVAGVYSTRPGFIGRLQPPSAEAQPEFRPGSVGRLRPQNAPFSEAEVPMAMVGRVPTKVSAENGSIKVGDLLVSSSTVGYAMKGTDRSQMLGAVIGKALAPLDSGIGVIMVLVTLQ